MDSFFYKINISILILKTLNYFINITEIIIYFVNLSKSK